MFSHVDIPPRERGITWSRFSSVRGSFLWQHLPVLPQETATDRAESRPRYPALARRDVHVGEHRMLVPSLQSPQGWPHPRRSRDASLPPPAPSRMDPVFV